MGVLRRRRRRLRLRLLLNARDQRPELGGNRGGPARQGGSPQTEEVRSLRKLSLCDPRHTIEEVRFDRWDITDGPLPRDTYPAGATGRNLSSRATRRLVCSTPQTRRRT